MTKQFSWITPETRKFLSRWYLVEGQTVEDRIRIIADKSEAILWEEFEGFADIFYGYMWKGYYSLSSPIWSNFWTDRGLPISCFGSYIWDDMSDILNAVWEVGMMSKYWGGTSGYFGDLRERGAPIKDNWESDWVVSMLKLFDTTVDTVSQGSTRRGSFAPYLPITHPDIEEFLEMCHPWSPIQRLSPWVTVSDEFMEQLENGWQKERAVWAKLITSRNEIGLPYIMFSWNANKNSPYSELGLEIKNSNLCSEIMLPVQDNESFVCNLSSLNLTKYDEWKDTDAVEVLTTFLDSVLTEFIDKVKELPHSHLDRAMNFAENHRAIWIGVLGWHSYLQQNMIPFESFKAKELNKEIFSFIRERSYCASEELRDILWAPIYWEKLGRRNTTLMAVAPTTSSAYIAGQVSQSIEPFMANIYTKKLAKGLEIIVNPDLKNLLLSMDKDTDEVWDLIKANNWSVQNLEFLSDEQKKVFKTFEEIPQFIIIDQAKDRQKFIDQGQSLNLKINTNKDSPYKTPAKDIHKLYVDAWKGWVKALYYQFGSNASQTVARKFECKGCEG